MISPPVSPPVSPPLIYTPELQSTQTQLDVNRLCAGLIHVQLNQRTLKVPTTAQECRLLYPTSNVFFKQVSPDGSEREIFSWPSSSLSDFSNFYFMSDRLENSAAHAIPLYLSDDGCEALKKYVFTRELTGSSVSALIGLHAYTKLFNDWSFSATHRNALHAYYLDNPTKPLPDMVSDYTALACSYLEKNNIRYEFVNKAIKISLTDFAKIFKEKHAANDVLAIVIDQIGTLSVDTKVDLNVLRKIEGFDRACIQHLHVSISDKDDVSYVAELTKIFENAELSPTQEIPKSLVEDSANRIEKQRCSYRSYHEHALSCNSDAKKSLKEALKKNPKAEICLLQLLSIYRQEDPKTYLEVCKRELNLIPISASVTFNILNTTDKDPFPTDRFSFDSSSSTPISSATSAYAIPFTLGQRAYACNLYDIAERYFRLVLQQNKTDFVWLYLGKTLARVRKFDEAHTCFIQAGSIATKASEILASLQPRAAQEATLI